MSEVLASRGAGASRNNGENCNESSGQLATVSCYMEKIEYAQQHRIMLHGEDTIRPAIPCHDVHRLVGWIDIRNVRVP